MPKKLYVGSLSFDTTEDGLKDLFSKVGKVESAKIILDKFSGKSRGFGFVEMSSDEEAQKAIDELNGKEVDNRKIIVDYAKPPRKRFSKGGRKFFRK